MYLPLDHLIMPLPPPPTFAQQQQQHTNTLRKSLLKQKARVLCCFLLRIDDNRQNGTSILVLGSVIVALVAGIFALQLNSTILYGDFVGLNLGVLIGLIIGFVLGIFITNLYSFL